MQEFFADYGLWLLIALLIVIGLVFLISGRSKAITPGQHIAPSVTSVEAQAPVSAPIAPPSVMPVTKADVVPSSPPVTVPDANDDDLLRLKGVGPKLNAQLTALGVTSFAQIAAWTDADIATIDTQLGTFKGRPVRDQWIDQAKYLAAGDVAGFEAKYGKL